MRFHEPDVPVAYSMIAAANKRQWREEHPVVDFLCYWTAFNNIYTTIAKSKGIVPRPVVRKGVAAMEQVGNLTMPKISPARERTQIDAALEEFTADLIEQLVQHPNTHFFVDRTPCWAGGLIPADARGQRLNGVLNVGYTEGRDNPVWAPIDVALYEAVLAGLADAASRRELAGQLLLVIYTVRNNAFHGGKNLDDASDTEILQKALPLLRLIVESFVHL